jgi:hypothetical protein
MTREEAVAEVARRSREDPARDRFSWLVRETAGGDYEVMRIGLPSRGPTVATSQPGEPAPRDDPRPPVSPDVAGF